MRIRQTATAYFSFPVERRRGAIGADGTATIHTQLPTKPGIARHEDALFAHGVDVIAAARGHVARSVNTAMVQLFLVLLRVTTPTARPFHELEAPTPTRMDARLRTS